MEIKGITETIFQYLRVRVITGELKPGQRLNETKLASDFGVSRGPLREALRILENERLVKNYPRKGTYVTKLTSKDFEEVYRSREMIECYAIDLIERDGLDTWKDALSTQLLISPPLPTEDSTPEEKLEFIHANAGFHIALVHATGNSWLMKFFETIGTTLARCQFLYAFTPGMKQRAAEDHQALLELLEIGAYDRAKARMRSHINEFLELLLGHHAEKDNDEGNAP